MSSKKGKKQPGPISTPIIAAIPPVIENTILPNADSPGMIMLKEETLRWLFSIIGSLVCYIIVANIIQHSYHPDLNALLESANKLSFTGDARPKPVESLLFRTGVVLISLGLLGFYALFSKIQLVKKLAGSSFFITFTTICFGLLIPLIYIDFAAQNPFANGGGDIPQHSRDYIENKSNFAFYFDGIFLGSNLLLYTFILVPAVACLFFLGIKKFKLESNKYYNVAVSGIGYFVAGGTVLAIILMNIFEFPYSFVSKYNFNANYYSMTQVYAGSPMIVDGFSNTYGLYPQFLNLIFHFIGLSIYKFTFAMAILLGLSFSFNFYSLKQFISNKVILFLGFTSVMFLPYIDDKLIGSFDCLFSFFPVRYLVPSTLTFLATLYLTRRLKIVYWLTFFIMAALIFWNPEFGMVSYVSWLLLNTYCDFYTKEGKVAFLKILHHWVIGIGVIIVVFISYKFLIYFIYGQAPDFKLMFGIALTVGKAGFACLPMKLVHPWNLMALVDMSGLFYAIIKWYKKEITPKSSFLLLISVISLGFFVYYEGRSHNCCFSVSTIFSFMILSILADELWSKIKEYEVFSLNLLFVVILYCISFSFVEIIYNSGRFNELVYKEDDKNKQADEQKMIENNTDYFLKNTQKGEKVYLFTAKQYTGLFFDANERKSAFNPGLQDMFLNSDITRLENRIRDSSFQIFIEPTLCNYYYLAKPFAAMAATYELKQGNKTMSVLTKRTRKLPIARFFERDKDVVFYQKYTEDTSGVEKRVNDAMGNKPVMLNSSFSVEALYYAEPQIYSYGTILGNMNDTSGFLIANILNSDNYLFGINGKGFTVASPANQWVYCVMNVYPDHMEIYQNGKLTGPIPLPNSIKQSPEKLYIGNLGFLRYYVGPISEICVSNKIIEKDQIQKTLDLISQAK
jgi:hypothetical protein